MSSVLRMCSISFSFFCIFKQYTSVYMRISDCSSDVCSSDLLDAMALYYLQSRGLPPGEANKLMLQAFVAGVFDGAEDEARLQELALAKQIGRASCRKRVCQYV